MILVLALFGCGSCGRLDNVYLPPNQRVAHGDYSSGSQSGSYPGSSASYSASTHSSYRSNDIHSGPIDRIANDVPILRIDNTNDGETYNYALETGNGISAQEQGDARGEGTRAHGGFSYTAPDGQVIQIQYTADENGFQPQGIHIPTAPPVPEEILKAIEQNLADEARGIFDDGQYREETGPGQKYASAKGQYNQEQGVVINSQYRNTGSNNQYIPPAPQRNNGGYKY